MRFLTARSFTSTTYLTLPDANTKIIELVSKGLFDETLRFYKKLHSSGAHLTTLSLPSLLKASSLTQSLHFSIQIHCIITKTGHSSDLITTNSFISLYGKCSQVDSARRLFDTIPVRDSVTWNSMVTCYIQNGHFQESIRTLKEMWNLGFNVKSELIASVISGCGKLGCLSTGREIHARAICSGKFGECVFLSTALVDMYSRCCELSLAMRVFERSMDRNEVSWTAMIAGCEMNGEYFMSFEVFRAMWVEGIKPNRVTLITVLPSCAALGDSRHGKEIHGYIIRHSLDSEKRVCGALIDMYSKVRGGRELACLVLEKAEERDVVMWTSIIGSYSQSGESIKALKFFSRMQMEGIKPNYVTVLAVITACIELFSTNQGQRLHGYIFKFGFNSEVSVGNSLIDMYSKCGCLDAALRVFGEMPLKDPISWSALISGYGLHGQGIHALRLFDEMQEKGYSPDWITFVAALSACNHSGLVEEGSEIFNKMIRDYGIVPQVKHYACYVDLLGRYGKIKEACEVLRQLPMPPSPSISSSLISACKLHGRFEEAEKLGLALVDSEPKNPANYTMLCMLYGESGNWTGVEEVRKEMKQRGIKKKLGWSRMDIEMAYERY